MIRVTIGTESFTAASLDEMTAEQSQAMIRAYQRGEAPRVETVDAPPAPPIVTPIFASSDQGLSVATSVALNAPGVPRYNDDFRATHVDEAARVRIEAQHAALNAAGIKVDASEQVAGTGVRMASIGYATQRARKAEHDAKCALVDVAHEIQTRIDSEHREDVEISARDLASALTVNGKIHVNGRALTEQSIRGLAARLESPMLGYVLGLRDRMTHDSRPMTPEERASGAGGEAFQARHALRAVDRAMIADVLRHECKRNPDVRLKMRTRNGGVDDVYAIVSPSYVEADATTILPEIMRALPKDTRATFAYDPASTQWEIRASVWTPTPVDEQAIGEAFEGYVSLRSRDNGTSRFRGDGGVTLIRCFNASTYNAGGASVERMHRGKVARDVATMIAAASRSIHTLCQAWGIAREAIVPMTDEEKKQGDAFLSAMWVDMLRAKPFQGVLRGNTRNHASGLVSAYHAERREPHLLVKADLMQAWTRYIQDQPADARRDAEAACGAYLVGGPS